MNENTYQFKGTDDYIISDDLMLTMNIAIKMNKPLLVKGEPGTGRHCGSHRKSARQGADSLEHQVYHEGAGRPVPVRRRS